MLTVKCTRIRGLDETETREYALQNFIPENGVLTVYTCIFIYK
jgi:hypothetical protein